MQLDGFGIDVKQSVATVAVAEGPTHLQVKDVVPTKLRTQSIMMVTTRRSPSPFGEEDQERMELPEGDERLWFSHCSTGHRRWHTTPPPLNERKGSNEEKQAQEIETLEGGGLEVPLRGLRKGTAQNPLKRRGEMDGEQEAKAEVSEGLQKRVEGKMEEDHHPQIPVRIMCDKMKDVQKMEKKG